MTAIEQVQSYLTHREEYGSWGCTIEDFALWARTTYERAQEDIRASVDAGILAQMYGDLYYNPKSQNLTCYVLDDMIPYCRPNDFSYVSFEKILFKYGAIQEPIAVLTVATMGESGRYETAFGSLQFTHIEIASMFLLLRQVFWSDDRQCYVASPYQAWKDLQQINRNIGLVDMELLERAMERYEDMPDPFLETDPQPTIRCMGTPRPLGE
ncbi:MAG: hypothetical protein IJU76_07525 [Desulfovibrionaceae bacterium]|nr:hypothetical protein [Desulfovibrionaceae bacterium]